MTFDPAIPLSGDSPSIFPAQNQTNYTRLQTIIGADHQFNLSATANDGYHNVVHLTQQAPTGALASIGRLYSKSSDSRIHQFYIDSSGDSYQVTPTLPIRACVNFSGVGAAAIRSQVNVASVVRDAQGQYTINFTTAMPNVNYIVQVTGMRNSSNTACVGSIRSSATYSNSVQTGFVKVEFSGSGSAPDYQDVLMGNVTIFSAI